MDVWNTLEGHAAWKREWRRTNADAIRSRRADMRALKLAAKDRPCVDCDRIFPPAAMDFDHLGDKKFKVSHTGMYSDDAILREIAKCEVVCVLCHRERTRVRFVYSDSATARKKRALQEKVNALKTGPCALCGEKYSPWLMDFDHLDPSTKVEKIADMVRRRAALQDILTEIEKCRLLCAVCHRVHTEGSRVN